MDAAPDALVDAGSDAPPTGDCWPQWRAGTVVLGPPTLIAAASTADYEHDPSFVPGDLELYFSAGTGSAAEFHRAVRASRTSPFVSLGPDTALSGPNADGRVSSAVGHTLVVVSSNRGGSLGSEDLYQAVRPSPTSPFGNRSTVLLASLNTPVNEVDPELSGDGLRLYFSRIDGEAQRVWLATRQVATDAFGTAVEVPIQNAPATHADPALSPDELVMIYTTFGGQTVDLRLATRPSVSVPFVDVGPLSINTGANEGDADLSSDGCELVFASDRAGGPGPRDIWISTVLP